MGALSPVAARLAIVGVSLLVSTVIPYFVQNRPVLAFVSGRIGPQIVDRATDAIEKKLGPAAPLPPVVCPPCPTPTPAVPDVDVVIPEPAPAPDVLPVRVVDRAVDVTESTWDHVWGAAKRVIRTVIGI